MSSEVSKACTFGGFDLIVVDLLEGLHVPNGPFLERPQD